MPTDIFSPQPATEDTAGKMFNWAGNFQYSTARLHLPKSVQHVQELVRKLDRVKALGSRHCFNDIADSRYHFISMKEMNSVVKLDPKAMTVTIEGGMNYGHLCTYLDQRGYALHNLASLPHISVVGACITSTHGSGLKNGSLSTAVEAMQVVNAEGDLVEFSKSADPDNFNAAVVNLGALGVTTRITLALEARYQMRQYVFEDMPLQPLLENFMDIFSSGYSVSLFTAWSGNNIDEVWIKLRTDDAHNIAITSNFFGGKAAIRNIHPISGIPAENCTEQMGIDGPWFERLPHFRMGFTPSSGEELQSEYFVPICHAVDAIMTIYSMGQDIAPHLLISEIRTIAADNLWLSPFYKEDSVAFHFTWKQDWPSVSKLLPRIEQALSQYNVKPHWGKLFTMSPETLHSRYPMLGEFRKFIARHDPSGKFRNDFLQRNIFT